VSHPEAGWYPDPSDADQLRYWDGHAWTPHAHKPVPISPATPSSSVATAPTRDGGRVTGGRRRGPGRTSLVASALAAALVVGAVSWGLTTDDDPDGRDAKDDVEQVVAGVCERFGSVTTPHEAVVAWDEFAAMVHPRNLRIAVRDACRADVSHVRELRHEALYGARQ
jgi:hypothetical protein